MNVSNSAGCLKNKIYRTILTALIATIGAASYPLSYANDAQVDLNRQALAAARSGNAKTFKETIVSGASVNTRNRLGDSLLITAIKNGQLENMQMLVERGADVNLANIAQVTPLMMAAYHGRPDMARILIDHHADVNALDQVQKTAMVYAAGTGQTDIVAMLLKTGPTSGVTVNTRYPNGLTALMWAGGAGHLATVEALLALGADSALVDNRGKTAAEMAADNSHLDVVKLLTTH